MTLLMPSADHNSAWGKMASEAGSIPIDVEVFQGDVPSRYVPASKKIGLVAWDTETSGLDWQTERLATCQLFVPGHAVAVVVITDVVPSNLLAILSDDSVVKVFHHAMFDLRFLCRQWHVKPSQVVCTKIASKLLDKHNERKHSLKSLLSLYLGVDISKEQQTSDWLQPQLTQDQIDYAVADVMYLPTLYSRLEGEMSLLGVLDLAHACYRHLPARTELELRGYGDVYSY